MPRFKEQAVCIRHVDWSETSQVVALFTENLGLIRGLAKGSKRTSPGAVAKYSGGIELLTAGQVVGIVKRNTNLATITEWDLQQPFAHFRKSLRTQRLGLYAADVVGAVMAEQDAHPRTYAALMDFFEGLKCDAVQKQAQALLKFQWRVLEDAGYRLELEQDVRSGDQLNPKRKTYTFDAMAGGFTCETLATSDQAGVWKVRAGTVEVLKGMATESSRGNTGGQATSSTRGLDDYIAGVERANRLLCVYLRTILGKQLPTMGVILDS